MLTSDGFIYWDEEFDFADRKTWGVAYYTEEPPEDSYVGLESAETETKASRLLKYAELENGEKGYYAYVPEWTWFNDFAGVPACHNPYQYHIISQILRLNEVHSIIELGTDYGALSLYLGVCGAVKGIPVYTFDIVPERSEAARPGFGKLGVEFIEMDYLSDEGRLRVLDIIGNLPTYIICDGDHGQKARELELFSAMIPPGSVISVHDYITEVTEEEADDIAKRHGLRPFGKADWRRHAVLFATWVKE